MCVKNTHGSNFVANFSIKSVSGIKFQKNVTVVTRLTLSRQNVLGGWGTQKIKKFSHFPRFWQCKISVSEGLEFLSDGKSLLYLDRSIRWSV